MTRANSVGADDSNHLLPFFAEAKLGDREQAVDNIIMAEHAIVDELGLSRASDQEQRWRFACADRWRELDEHLPTVVERPDRPPGRPVPFNCIIEVQGIDRDFTGEAPRLRLS